MKAIIDIGHPAHVHYFRNLISLLKSHNHKILVVSRNRDVTLKLLENYNIEYVNRGTGNNSRFGKLIYMFYADIFILLHSLKFRPDIFLSFSSPYAAQVSWLLRKSHITLNDTEHSDRNHRYFTYPFTKTIITPFNYQNNLGNKQIRIKNVIESLYLSDKYFKSDISGQQILGLSKDQQYIVLRFVAWKSHHDYGQVGINNESKEALIKLLEKHFKVFITNENDNDDRFLNYKLNIPPHQVHIVLRDAFLFITESGTMASEASYLGTPVIYVNSLPLMCYIKLEQESQILKHFKNSEGLISYVEKIIFKKNLKAITLEASRLMKKDFIELTDFLLWFIENYPHSREIMEDNPNYQNNFKN